MLFEDGLTPWPVVPQADPSANVDHQLGGESHAPLDQAHFAEELLNAQDETYFEQFIDNLQEEINNQAEATTNQTVDKQSKNKLVHLDTRFHKCQCVECLPCGKWMASPLFITIRLPYSGIKVDVLGRNSLRLSGNSLSLFISLDESKNLAPTVAIIFHNNIRVFVRHYGSNPKRTMQRGVDIISKQYSVTFRSGSASFTSDSNLLTYSIDKSGCKTKICKNKGIGQNDFVTRQFQYHTGPNRNRDKRHYERYNKPLLRNCRINPMELLRKCQFKSNPSENNLAWTIDESLNIIEQPNGSLYVHNDKSEMYLSVHRNNNSLSLQLASVCIILNKSGHLFVANKLKSRSRQQSGHISDTGEMSQVRQDIEMLSHVTSNGRSINSQPQHNQDYNNAIDSNQKNCSIQNSKFSINRVMTNSEQFAICGIGGLLVKHYNRRAGLNQKNQICLL